VRGRPAGVELSLARPALYTYVFLWGCTGSRHAGVLHLFGILRLFGILQNDSVLAVVEVSLIWQQHGCVAEKPFHWH